MQQAAEAIKTLDDAKLADYLREQVFTAVVGDVKFGAKGEWAQTRVLHVQSQNTRDPHRSTQGHVHLGRRYTCGIHLRRDHLFLRKSKVAHRMQITRKRRTRVPAVAAQFLLGIAGLALITFVCFRLGFGLARTGFAYVIMVALVSLLGSFSASVVLSIVAAACLNYFFAPPLFDFRIDVPEDIERIAAFLVTSLVVTALTTKLRASEARFRTFADHATDAFFLLDDHSIVLDVNRQACDGLGYSREELIGKHRSDFDVGLDETSIQGLKQRISPGKRSLSRVAIGGRTAPPSLWRFASANLSKADVGFCAWCAISPSVSGQRMSCAQARCASAASSITLRMVSSFSTSTRPFSTSTGRRVRAWVTAASR